MDAPYFNVDVAEEPGGWTIRFAGEVDYAASLDLISKLEQVTERCETDLLLDLSKVTLLDSEGIKMLMKVWGRMREKSQHARIVSCSKAAERVLRLVGADDLLGMANGIIHGA